MYEMMNKKGFLWAAIAALALLGALLLLSIPTPPPRVSDNRHFGLVKDVYTFASDDEWTPVELEGDTDVFPSAEVNLSLKSGHSYFDIYDFDTRTYVPFSEVYMTVRFETTLRQKLMLTSAHIRNGKVVEAGDNSPHGSGYIERRGEDGEWTLLRRLGSDVLSVDDEGIVTFRCALPNGGGEYRFTLHLRKYFRTGAAGYGNVPYDPDNFSTGEEQYTISYTVTVPEPSDIELSGKPFDLLSFSLEYDGNNPQYPTDHSNFELALLANGVDATFLRHEDLRLQYLDGNDWVDVESDHPLLFAAHVQHVNTTATVTTADGEGISCMSIGVSLLTAKSGSYRITLRFTEKEHGRGRTYPLTIYFDIPEETTR